MEKTLRIDLMPPCGQSREAMRCVNLMPAPDGESLCPAPLPAPADIPAGWRPLAAVACAGVSRNLAVRGLSVGIVSRGRVDRPLVLDAAPECVTQCGQYLYIMTSLSSWQLRIDPDLGLTRVNAAGPSMPLLSAVAETPAHMRVQPVALSRDYAADERLLPADSSRITRAVCEAYEEIDREVRAAGMFWHPVVAYVRALDINGREVLATEPRVLCHPSGLEAPDSIVFGSRDGAVTSAATVDVPRWSLRAEFPAVAPGSSTVAAYEVVCSPMLYTADLSREPVVSRPRRADSDSFCSVSFIPTRVTPPVRFGTGAVLSRLVGRLPALASAALRVSASATASQCSVPPLPASSVVAEVKSLEAVERTSPAARSYARAMFAAPHSFRAAKVARSGSCILWADITVDRFCGWDPRHLATSFSPTPWHGCVEVRFADGSSRVAACDAADHCPAALSPLLSYPAPDAVSMTVTISSGGVTRRRVFPLTADPSGTRAVYIDPSLKPVSPSDALEAYAVPAENPAAVTFPSCIAAADADSPLCLLGSATLAADSINALMPMPTGQSSWDYGRTRFYVFSSGGILMVNADTSRNSLSLSLLDSRVVDTPQAVTLCEEGVAAVASGDVVVLAGSKVSRIADIPSTRALVWVHSHHELWCLGDTFTKVLCMDRGRRVYEMSTVFVPSQAVPGYVVRASDGTVCVAGHASATPVDILWQGTVDLGREVRGSVMVRADIGGTFDSLAVDLRREVAGRTAPAPELLMSAAGQLVAPLARRVWLSPLRRLNVSISATGSDIALASITVKT